MSISKTQATVGVAICCLLFVAVLSRPAPAQVEYGGLGACCLPGGCNISAMNTCEATYGGVWLGDSTICAQCPLPPPTVVSVSMGKWLDEVAGKYQIVRAWSDGHLDAFSFEIDTSCGITDLCGPVVIVTGTCTTDIDRNGDTGINDFLTLLGGWGACR